MTTIETLIERYQSGRITEAMLQVYKRKGIITQEQLEEILSSKED